MSNLDGWLVRWVTFCQHDFRGSTNDMNFEFVCKEHVVGGQCTCNFLLYFFCIFLGKKQYKVKFLD